MHVWCEGSWTKLIHTQGSISITFFIPVHAFKFSFQPMFCQIFAQSCFTVGIETVGIIQILTSVLLMSLRVYFGNSGNRNRKQKMEMENGNSQILMVKPLINDHLLKTTSVQRPHN